MYQYIVSVPHGHHHLQATRTAAVEVAVAVHLAHLPQQLVMHLPALLMRQLQVDQAAPLLPLHQELLLSLHPQAVTVTYCNEFSIFSTVALKYCLLYISSYHV